MLLRLLLATRFAVLASPGLPSAPAPAAVLLCVTRRLGANGSRTFVPLLWLGLWVALCALAGPGGARCLAFPELDEMPGADVYEK